MRKTSLTISEFIDMRISLFAAFTLITFYGTSQSLDFGLDFKLNKNTLSNRWVGNGSTSTIGYADGNPYDLKLPGYNFGFKDENGETVFVRFAELKMNNNFEVPLFIRYTTKNNWFFNFKISGAKFQLEYDGIIFRDKNYYQNRYGTFEEYQTNYGGTFSGTPVNGQSAQNYNDTTAFISWFENQVNDDPYSQAQAKYVEELKFRSVFFDFGRKFLRHKKVHPYFNIGMGFRTAIKSYKRKYFEIDDNYLGKVLTRRDVSKVSAEIPSFSRNSLALRIGFGMEFYRYHIGGSADYSFNLSTKWGDNKTEVFDYRQAGIGFGTLNFYIGADLFTKDLRTKNTKEEVYKDEYQMLSSSLRKRRSWSMGVYVKSPIHSKMNNLRDFSLLTIRDRLDPETGAINKNWQSLSFRDISIVNWSPKFEFGFRFNIIKWLDMELLAGFSRLRCDVAVQEFRTNMNWNSSTMQYNFDTAYTSLNYAVYRSSFVPFTFGTNLYFTLFSNGVVDLRLFGGASANFLAISYPNPSPEFGVNGQGNDIYTTFQDFNWYGGNPPGETAAWYSNYADDIDLSLTPAQLLAKYDAAGRYPLQTYNSNQKSTYLTLNAGGNRTK